LNLTAGGDISTARNNPVSLRAPTGSLRLGLEFDAPFTRLLERNAYRETLIRYQRSRRGFIQSQDSLHLGLRALIRQIEQLRNNLDIQRRAVAIAIRRVDSTRANLYAPVPSRQPGQRAAQFGPTSAINLLSSLSSLRDTQNSFLRTWLNYYAARMRLVRELGIMKLNDTGNWVDEALPPLASMLPEVTSTPTEKSSTEPVSATTVGERFHDRILKLQTKIEKIVSDRYYNSD
jgi:outer membrane protein TolC